MPDLPIDYEALFKDGDRSWSLRLVERVREGVQEEELQEILDYVDEFNDFRMEVPLTQIMEDTSLSDTVRDQASQVLCHLTTLETAVERRIWWSSGDAVLMRYSIQAAERCVPEEAALIEKIARDPSDKFHADAIKSLSYGFSEPLFQSLKINALSHPDPLVRESAAKALYWDQPVCAEVALLKAAEDPCHEVACAALNTLCWYRSKNVLLALHDLRCSGRVDLVNCYNCTFQWVLNDCLDLFRYGEDESEKALAFYRSWLEPLWKIVSFCKTPSEDTENSSSLSNADPGQPITDGAKPAAPSMSLLEEYRKPSVAEIIAEYGDPNKSRRSWQDSSHRWKLYSESERTELTEFFLASPDHLVRKISARAFAEWNATEALVRLIFDPAHNVRRAACYAAKHHSPNEKIKDALDRTFRDVGTTDSFAVEVLESYIIHAESDELGQWLLQLVKSDWRELIRVHSIWALWTRIAHKFTEVIPLLYEEPMLTWSLHAAILENWVEAELPPLDLNPLLGIDDLEVQGHLAKLRARPPSAASEKACNE